LLSVVDPRFPAACFLRYKQAPRSLLDGKERGVTLATSYFRVTYRDTIIGAAAFHFRVRNGNGWCHCAGITRGLELKGVLRACWRAALRFFLSRVSGDGQLPSSMVGLLKRTVGGFAFAAAPGWFSDICI
jgi:hypothetical protein